VKETLGQWARAAKAKTDGGALLFWDDELWPKAKWRIDKEGVRVTSGNCTLFFGEIGDGGTHLTDIKRRARFLIDAPST
jgi:hypothetical protein